MITGDHPPIEPAMVDGLRGMMRSVVTSGTAERIADQGEVYGKTGEAEVEGGSHSWFVGYRGDIAFATLVVRGGSSDNAVAVTREMRPHRSSGRPDDPSGEQVLNPAGDDDHGFVARARGPAFPSRSAGSFSTVSGRRAVVGRLLMLVQPSATCERTSTSRGVERDVGSASALGRSRSAERWESLRSLVCKSVSVTVWATLRSSAWTPRISSETYRRRWSRRRPEELQATIDLVADGEVLAIPRRRDGADR